MEDDLGAKEDDLGLIEDDLKLMDAVHAICICCTVSLSYHYILNWLLMII